MPRAVTLLLVVSFAFQACGKDQIGPDERRRPESALEKRLAQRFESLAAAIAASDTAGFCSHFRGAAATSYGCPGARELPADLRGLRVEPGSTTWITYNDIDGYVLHARVLPDSRGQLFVRFARDDPARSPLVWVKSGVTD